MGKTEIVTVFGNKCVPSGEDVTQATWSEDYFNDLCACGHGREHHGDADGPRGCVVCNACEKFEE